MPKINNIQFLDIDSNGYHNMMGLYQTVSGEIVTGWRDFKFPGDLFSLGAFRNILNGVLVFGSYALAAAVIPFVVDVLALPIVLGLMGIGAALMIHAVMNSEPQQLQNDPKMVTGGFLTLLGAALPTLSHAIPFVLAGIFMLRAYQNYQQYSQKHRDEGEFEASGSGHRLGSGPGGYS